MVISTPAGKIPQSLLGAACKALSMRYEEPIGILNWFIISDSPEESEKYRDLINAESTGQTTALKHLVECAVLSGYQKFYKDPEKATDCYLKNTNPAIRIGVIGDMHKENTMTKNLAMNEKQVKAEKAKKAFNKKMNYLNS